MSLSLDIPALIFQKLIKRFGNAHAGLVSSLWHGPKEYKVERHDAYRVRVQRNDGPPVPRRAPVLDWLEAGMPDGAGSPV